MESRSLLVGVYFAGLYCGVWSQGAGGQARDLLHLGTTGNNQFVNTTTCTIGHTTTTLNCSLTNSPELIVDGNGNTFLERMVYQLCLCASALTVKYFLSDAMEFNRSCMQCPTEVPIEQLKLVHDLTVFETLNDKNETVNNIRVVVWINVTSGETFELLNNSISLTEQDNATCPNGTNGPPENCLTPTTPPPMTTPPIQPTFHSTTSDPVSEGNTKTIVIVVLVVSAIVAIIVLTAIVVLCVVCRRRPEPPQGNGKPCEGTQLMQSGSNQ